MGGVGASISMPLPTQGRWVITVGGSSSISVTWTVGSATGSPSGSRKVGRTAGGAAVTSVACSLMSGLDHPGRSDGFEPGFAAIGLDTGGRTGDLDDEETLGVAASEEAGVAFLRGIVALGGVAALGGAGVASFGGIGSGVGLGADTGFAAADFGTTGLAMEGSVAVPLVFSKLRRLRPIHPPKTTASPGVSELPSTIPLTVPTADETTDTQIPASVLDVASTSSSTSA